MCLAVLALDAHPRYAVVLAANRDEFHARAAAPAAWGNGDDGFDAILAGRDLVAGGTWLGVHRDGRFAFVTNVRQGTGRDPAARTRGELVPRVLHDGRPLASVFADVAHDGHAYNGFNLLAGDARGASWVSNRAAGIRAIRHGVHGLSNAALDTPWPKVVRVKAALTRWLGCDDDDPAPLFAALADRSGAPDHELPATGVTLERERMLASPFIVGDDYGTRCSTVLLIGRGGAARFEERSFGPDGAASGTRVESFRAGSREGEGAR